MVSQMVSIAVDGICCKQIVPLILTAPGIETRHCDRLLALLAEHEAEAIDPFWEGTRADYFMNRFFLHDLQHRTGTFDPRHMKEELDIKGNVDSWVACIKFSGDLGGGRDRIGDEKLKALVSRLKTPAVQRQKDMPYFRARGPVARCLSDDDYIKACGCPEPRLCVDLGSGRPAGPSPTTPRVRGDLGLPYMSLYGRPRWGVHARFGIGRREGR